MAVVQITFDQIKELLDRGNKGDMQAMNQAESMLNHIMNRDPNNPFPAMVMSGIYLQSERAGAAVHLLDSVLSKVPNLAEAWNNKGTAYRREHHNDKAESAFQRAIELNPSDADVYNNLGTLHINEGSPEKAVEYFENALKHNPSHRHAHWNLGLAYLELEELEKGFPLYVWGLSTEDRQKKSYSDAVWWHGEKDTTLVIYDEQGVGDSVMFESMIPDICKDQKHVILDCHPRLESLMRRSFAHIENLTVYGTRKASEQSDWVEKFESEHGPILYKAPIATAAIYYRSHLKDFPGVAFVKPNMDLVEEYKQRIQACGPGPYIGVSLYGGHKKTRKDLRCLQVREAGKLFNLPATFISVEYTDREEEYTELEKTGVKVHRFRDITESTLDEYWTLYDGDKNVGQFKDKYEAKHYEQAMVKSTPNIRREHHKGPAFDLDKHFALLYAIKELGGKIVSVNQSNVWFCGSLGVPVHVLTPKRCAWRYGYKRSDNYWFNSIKQYRQEKDGDWSDALSALVEDLDIKEIANAI